MHRTASFFDGNQLALGDLARYLICDLRIGLVDPLERDDDRASVIPAPETIVA